MMITSEMRQALTHLEFVCASYYGLCCNSYDNGMIEFLRVFCE